MRLFSFLFLTVSVCKYNRFLYTNFVSITCWIIYFSNSFLVVSSWYIGSCCLQTVLLPFQLDSFSFFLCLIAMVRTSNTMLNKSGWSCQPCFVPDHNGNAFDLSMLSMMLAVGLLYMAFVILQYEPSTPIFWEFLS